MKQELLDKYNVPVPRYTSYPPANYFHDGFNDYDYADALQASNNQKPELISFYFHIPFCHRLCHYCGCNSYPVPEGEIVDRYVEALHKEIDLVLPLLDNRRKVSQIHYGGGSPTVLPAIGLEELNDHVLDKFPTIANPEIAVECHPGWIMEQGWVQLVKSGFNRLSIGVQDFNKEVLRGVNRQSSRIPMEDVMEILRSSTYVSIWIFLRLALPDGKKALPRRSKRAVAMKPDRLVTFSYAHVPWAFPRQQILEKVDCHRGDEGDRMSNSPQDPLRSRLPADIGLDHSSAKTTSCTQLAERTATS
ncbi:MAG: radical SAM protein [Parabacteroides johnsonii]